ncbi:hypothetical protein JCM8547_003122 [Rhodosporidiobolus lusitaniae]
MPISLLSSSPPSLTQEELSALSQTTPSSFDGIPPLLRHQETDGVHVKVEPAVQGFTGVGLEGELWVTEGALSFFSPSSSTGLSIPYPHLTLHAISRPAANGASTSGDAERPSVYIQFEEVEGAEDMDDYDGSGSREMWITPSNADNVEKIFSTLSYCATLHTKAPSSAPGVHSASSLNTDGAAGESTSHFNNPSAALFASMGLDPDSMVYAGADGELAGPGLAALLADEASEGAEQYEDSEEQVEGETGRMRSDFVNPGRARGAPY